MINNIYFNLIPVFFVLILTVIVINKLFKLDLAEVKYPEIDGIRGYLAFFVFLHHSYIWQQYILTKKWEEPKSHLFNHFGQTSVVLFFIITAFLFTTKLVETKTHFDWNQYLKSRLFRLFPMYFCVVCLVFLIVAYCTHFQQNDSIIHILKSSLSWICFSIKGTNDINGFKDTFLMNSGVTWTLPYEWMFYFLLPLLALLFKKKVTPKVVIFFTLIFLIILYINQSSLKYFIPFIGGILASFILKNKSIKEIVQKPFFTFIAIVLVAFSIIFFESGKGPIAILISSIVFIIIASGNSIFGLLSSSFSRKFGQITYSLYLVHGTLLFIIFYMIIGMENATKLSNFHYWEIIALSVIPLLFISQLTFKYIELPMIKFVKNKK